MKKVIYTSKLCLYLAILLGFSASAKDVPRKLSTCVSGALHIDIGRVSPAHPHSAYSKKAISKRTRLASHLYEPRRTRRVVSKPSRVVSSETIVRDPTLSGSYSNRDIFYRYMSLEEALKTQDSIGLVLKNKDHVQKKWIADPGRVDPRTLGKRENYLYRVKIYAKPGTRRKVKSFEEKPRIEPGRYAIPPEDLEWFNDQILEIEIHSRDRPSSNGK